MRSRWMLLLVAGALLGGRAAFGGEVNTVVSDFFKQRARVDSLAQKIVDFLAGRCPSPAPGIAFELLTGPEVLKHRPGPGAQERGDGRLGTADDSIQPEPTVPPTPGRLIIHGIPNDLAGGSCPMPPPLSLCGLPGSPGTRLLHGTSLFASEESSLHPPESDQLSLAVPGHGAYSYVWATLDGGFETVSYLAGGLLAVLTDTSRVASELRWVNATLAGTTLAPNVLSLGPFNLDLVTVAPGPDRVYSRTRRDETGESIVRRCNGISPGVDGVEDWFPVSTGPFPKFPDLLRGNQGEWSLRPIHEGRGARQIDSRLDLLMKVPAQTGFLTLQNLPLNGYLFPVERARALLDARVRGVVPNLDDLPDIPGFPGSGVGLARYLVDVLVPKAVERGDLLVGLLRGSIVVEIIGVPTELDFTLAVGASPMEVDLCTLEARPCSF